MHGEIARRPVAVFLADADDLAEDAPHAVVHGADLGVAETVDRTPRVNVRLEQRLVRVEVADAGNEVLRHQQRFGRTAALRDPLSELRQRQLQRIGAEVVLRYVRVGRRRQIDDAEEAHVDEGEVAFREVEDDARETRLVIREILEIPGHPEVEMEPGIARIGEEVLAVPTDTLKRMASERAGKRLLA